MKNIQSGIKDIQRKADLSDTEAQQIQVQIDKIKSQMGTLQQEKDLLMMRKHAAEELASKPAQRKKFYAEEAKKLQT